MADQNPTGLGAVEPASPAAEDLRDQALVLAQLLSNWPVHLAVDDLLREADPEPDSPTRDRIERAVRDLAAAGLALRCAEAVVPSRAALLSDRLSSRL